MRVAVKLMRTTLPTLLLCLLAPAGAALAPGSQPNAAAPSPHDNPLSTHTKFAYGMMKQVLLRSAEKMPEDGYGFRPTDAVRTYGQMVGHVADSQYMFCSVVLGEKNPALTLKVEKTKSSKADEPGFMPMTNR